MLAKLLKLVKTYQADIILTLAVILISITAFNLGKISAIKQQKTPITIKQLESNKKVAGDSTPQETKNRGPQTAIAVVASKASKARVYHFPWCPGASKIAEKNKITFATEAAAISAGYTLAGNCNK